jgi:hypothetical protein
MKKREWVVGTTMQGYAGVKLLRANISMKCLEQLYSNFE